MIPEQGRVEKVATFQNDVGVLLLYHGVETIRRAKILRYVNDYFGHKNKSRPRTGIPQEQEIPAPVTTTIFLLLAIDKEISESARRVCVSVAASSRLRVTVMVAENRQTMSRFSQSQPKCAGSFVMLYLFLARTRISRATRLNSRSLISNTTRTKGASAHHHRTLRSEVRVRSKYRIPVAAQLDVVVESTVLYDPNCSWKQMKFSIHPESS
jgi:hypothetical protein